jgi:hypothetical protein
MIPHGLFLSRYIPPRRALVQVSRHPVRHHLDQIPIPIRRRITGRELYSKRMNYIAVRRNPVQPLGGIAAVASLHPTLILMPSTMAR